MNKIFFSKDISISSKNEIIKKVNKKNFINLEDYCIDFTINKKIIRDNILEFNTVNAVNIYYFYSVSINYWRDLKYINTGV